MERSQIISEKLDAVTDDDWRIIQQKCKEYIRIRLKGRTKFGAHCENRLGMPAFNYYFPRAVEKIYEKVINPDSNKGWDWKFEKHTLLEQIIVIINTLINNEVDKFKRESRKKPKIDNFENEPDALAIEDASNDTLFKTNEEDYLAEVEIVKKAIKGDADLELLFLYIEEKGKNYKEICHEMGIERRKLYKLAEKLKKKVFSYRQIKRKNSNGSK